MPNYIYKCICGKEVSIICKMSEYQSSIICEKCGEVAERKIEDLLPQNYIVNCQGFYGGGGKSKF